MTHITDFLPENPANLLSAAPQQSIFDAETGVETLPKNVRKPRDEVSEEDVIQAKLRKGMEYAKRRMAAVQARSLEDPQVLQLTFPSWDESRRGVPNPFIRGGLFTTRKSAQRFEFKGEQIASLSNITVLYSGEELRQDDLSVWMAIVTLAKNKNLDRPIYFTAYSLIKDMGWRIHVASYARLKSSIERMKMTSMKISMNQGRGAYAGSLIRDYAFDALDDSGHEKWMVRLEPNIANLFVQDSTTLLEWEQRKCIGSRATLTLWLHTFYSSHREPIPYQIAKLHELCKSEEKRMSNFKMRVRESLEKLIEVGLLESYAITNDVVKVVRKKYSKERLRKLGVEED